MKRLSLSAPKFGAALIVVGMAISLYLHFADRNDEDYTRPIFVAASLVGLWLVAAGSAVLVNKMLEGRVGAGVPWLGLCLIVLGAGRLIDFDYSGLEWWRAYFFEGKRLVDVSRGQLPVLGVCALSIGVLLCLQFLVCRGLRVGDEPTPAKT